MGGNLPANAGDTGSIPGPGRFPHAAEQLGPCATTTEPAHLEPVLRNKRGHGNEKPAHHSLQLEKACAQNKDPTQPKIKTNK